MARKPSSKRAHEAYRLIVANPGIHRKDLLHRMGIKDRRNTENILSSCESGGLLVCEDDEGYLYPFRIEDTE